MPEKMRRVIRSLTINEICAVGDPTQDGARVVLVKRAEPLGESERRRRIQIWLHLLASQIRENSRALAEHWLPPASLLRLVANGIVQGRNLESHYDQFTHSVDYRSVNLRGRQFFLTPLQAHVVQILHEDFLNGTPDIGQHALLEEIGSPQERLSHVFRRSDAWGELIVHGKTKELSG